MLFKKIDRLYFRLKDYNPQCHIPTLHYLPLLVTLTVFASRDRADDGVVRPVLKVMARVKVQIGCVGRKRVVYAKQICKGDARHLCQEVGRCKFLGYSR